MTRSLTRPRGLFALLASIAMLLTLLPTQSAKAGASGSVTWEHGFFYMDDGIAVFTGPPFEQGCEGNGFPAADWHAVNLPNGAGQNTNGRWESDVMLYDLAALGMSHPFDLIIAACTAHFTGGDVPQPDAVGSGVVSSVMRCQWESASCPDVMEGPLPEGAFVDVHNWVHATVTFTDGETRKVTARAKYTHTITADGLVEDVQVESIHVR